MTDSKELRSGKVVESVPKNGRPVSMGRALICERLELRSARLDDATIPDCAELMAERSELTSSWLEGATETECNELMAEMRELTSGNPEAMAVGWTKREAPSPDSMELITDTKELISGTPVGSAVTGKLRPDSSLESIELTSGMPVGKAEIEGRLRLLGKMPVGRALITESMEFRSCDMLFEALGLDDGAETGTLDSREPMAERSELISGW